MQFHGDISEVPQHLWVHPVRVHGFTFVQLPSGLPDLVTFHKRKIFLPTNYPLVFRAWD